LLLLLSGIQETSSGYLHRHGYLNGRLEWHGTDHCGGCVRHRAHRVDLSRRRIAYIHVQIAQVVEQVSEQVHHVVDVVGEALATIVLA
jgi:hypothetical protein